MRPPIYLALVVTIVLSSFKLYAQSTSYVLIAYFSQSGNTKSMAEAVASGVQQVDGVDYILKPLEEVTEQEVLNASAIIVGSPVYNANVAPKVQEFINSWPFEDRPLKNKIGAAFVTGGGISIGEETVMLGILRSMLIHGMVVVGGEEVEAAFGASAITAEGEFTGRPIGKIFLLKAEGLGKRVAELCLKYGI